MRKAVLLGAVCIFFGWNASANDAPNREQRDVAIDAGLNAAKSSLLAMENSRARPVMQVALNAIVAHAIAALREKGFKNDADQAEREWNTRFANAFNEDLESLYLGEHSPLSQWLADFYRKLQDKVGNLAVRALGLDDLFIFNYGIPVMLHPRGYHGEKWSKSEYALHFVPVTGAATYWVAYSACTTAVSGLFAYLCGEASSVIRSVVERTIAPPLSDYVYAAANGSSSNKPEYDFDKLTDDAHHVPDAP